MPDLYVAPDKERPADWRVNQPLNHTFRVIPKSLSGDSHVIHRLCCIGSIII
jgi:hypothetical protein